MIPHTLQNLLAPFTKGKKKEHFHKLLNPLELVKEKNKPVNEIEISNQKKIQETDKIVGYNIFQ